MVRAHIGVTHSRIEQWQLARFIPLKSWVQVPLLRLRLVYICLYEGLSDVGTLLHERSIPGFDSRALNWTTDTQAFCCGSNAVHQ